MRAWDAVKDETCGSVQVIDTPADLEERRKLLRNGFQYNRHNGVRERARRLRQLARQGLAICVSCEETKPILDTSLVNEKRICRACRQEAEERLK